MAGDRGDKIKGSMPWCLACFAVFECRVSKLAYICSLTLYLARVRATLSRFSVCSDVVWMSF